jgi:hypothetical protein
VFYLFQEDVAKASTEGPIGDNEALTQAEETPTIVPPADKKQKKTTKETVEVKTLSKETKYMDCHARYQQHENWQKISDIFESFYMTIEEMSGEHHFQKMPLDAVKSYADSGDADAMFHYGTELLWKGGFGFYFNELNRSPVETHQERRELSSNHQLDLPVLEEASDYLMRSAALGKLGGIIELKLIHQHILKKQIRNNKHPESIKDALVLNIAYENLLEEVFVNDYGIIKTFLFAEESKQLFETVAKQYPSIDMVAIREEALAKNDLLFNNWKRQREDLGAAVHPDKFPANLEQHMSNKEKECGKE